MPDLHCKRKPRFSVLLPIQWDLRIHKSVYWAIELWCCILSLVNLVFLVHQEVSSPVVIPTWQIWAKHNTRTWRKTGATKSESLPFLDIIGKVIVLSQYFSIVTERRNDSQIYTSDKEKYKFLSMNMMVNFHLLTKIVDALYLVQDIRKNYQIYVQIKVERVLTCFSFRTLYLI